MLVPFFFDNETVEQRLRIRMAAVQGIVVIILVLTPLLLLGTLRFLLPLDEELDLERLFKAFYTVTIIVILVIAIVIFFLSQLVKKHVSRPLIVLSERARGYTDGVPVLIREQFTIREIDDLARSMNDLMDTVMSREESLQRLNESLEETVAERTRVLENTIENLQRAREQLLLSEKMAVLGSLVSGVAHEINTPLSIGVTAASFLNDRTRTLFGEWDEQALTKENLERFLKDSDEGSRIIQTNLDQATRIINSLKQVAVDQQVDEYREFELGSYIRDILLSLKHQLKTGKHIISSETDGVVMVKTYPGAITQILNNLVINSITHGFDNLDGGRININARKDDEEVVMYYSDNGRGLTEEESLRIFEQFYTTRRDRGGTGLGMKIVYDLISGKLGGSIEIRPPEEGGTGFMLKFPQDCTEIVSSGETSGVTGENE